MKKMLETEMNNIEKIEVQERFVNPLGMILSGTFIMLCGLFLGFSRMNPYMKGLDPIFIMVLEYSGLLIASQGGIVVLRGIIGNNWVSLHQFMIVVQVVLSLASIGLLVVLYNNPSAIPYFTYEETTETLVLIEFPFSMRWIQLAMTILIALTIIDALSDVYKAGKLEKYKPA